MNGCSGKKNKDVDSLSCSLSLKTRLMLVCSLICASLNLNLNRFLRKQNRFLNNLDGVRKFEFSVKSVLHIQLEKGTRGTTEFSKLIAIKCSLEKVLSVPLFPPSHLFPPILPLPLISPLPFYSVFKNI